MRGDEVLLIWAGIFLVWGVIWGLIGLAVGKGKGRGGVGFTLGFLLGFIGVIIVAVLSPTPESERRRYALITVNDPTRPRAPAGPTDDQLRQQAVAEVVRRDPSLASASDPDSLKALAAATAAVMEELRVKAALDAVNQEQQAQAAVAEREAQRAQARQRDELRAAERREVAERERLERAAHTDQLPPFRRWVARNRYLTAGLAILVVAAIVVPSVLVVQKIGRDRSAATAAEASAEAQALLEKQRAEAEAQAAADAAAAEAQVQAAYADALTSCAPDRYKGEPDVGLLTAWSKCPQAQVRRWVAQAVEVPDDVLATLALDDDARIRLVIASNPKAPFKVLAQLASDPSVAVRVALAGNSGAPPEVDRLLVKDQSTQVRLAAVKGGNVGDLLLRRVAASDPSAQVREVAMKTLFGGLCGKNLSFRTYLAGTRWSGKLYADDTGTTIDFLSACRVTFDGDDFGRWRQDGATATWNPATNRYTVTVSGDYLIGRSSNGPFRLQRVQ